MPELRCDNCGSANDVHSEFLVFCKGCGKRLSGTFAEWKKLNPGGTFDLYLIKLQETQAATSLVTGTSKYTIKSRKVIFTTILVAVLTGIFWLVNHNKSGPGLTRTPSADLNKEWTRYTGTRFGLSVALPAKPVSKKVNNPANQEVYFYQPEKGFQLMLYSEQHLSGNILLDELLKNAINVLLNRPGIANFNYDVIPLTKGDVPGLLIRGRFENNGVNEIFYHALFVKGSISWELDFRLLEGDDNGITAVQKVLDSIEINYFSARTALLQK